MDTRILDELEAVYAEELTVVQNDLSQLESAVGTLVKSLGAGLL